MSTVTKAKPPVHDSCLQGTWQNGCKGNSSEEGRIYLTEPALRVQDSGLCDTRT